MTTPPGHEVDPSGAGVYPFVFSPSFVEVARKTVRAAPCANSFDNGVFINAPGGSTAVALACERGKGWE